MKKKILEDDSVLYELEDFEVEALEKKLGRKITEEEIVEFITNVLRLEDLVLGNDDG